MYKTKKKGYEKVMLENKCNIEALVARFGNVNQKCGNEPLVY